jgi:DNA-directed RNA polymerase III subunit RPC1
VPTPLPSVSLLLQVVLGGSKGGLFGTLNSDYGSAAAAAVMGRLAKMAARHMGNRGFSIGMCLYACPVRCSPSESASFTQQPMSVVAIACPALCCMYMNPCLAKNKGGAEAVQLSTDMQLLTSKSRY